MKGSELRAAAPLYFQPIRWTACICVSIYHRIAYRVRGWGSLPRRRGPSLVVANHAHDIESPVIVADLAIRSFSWRDPIFTVSSRRMWEPGFFGERLRLPMLRGINLGWLVQAVGMQPIENDLQSRPLVGLAYTFEKRHGDLPVSTVFRERLLEQFPPSVRTLKDLLPPKHFMLGRTFVKLTDVLEPYRAELLKATRDEIEADIAHFERLARDGATIFLTPEGFYTTDGKMQRLRGILSRLEPLAKIWLVGVSYDPYVEKRLHMLYRVAASVDNVPLETQLKRTRPITASAVLCSWLYTLDAPFSIGDAIAAVYEAVASLPNRAFVAPELRSNLPRTVQRVLDGMERLQTLRRDGDTYVLTSQRTHSEFPKTTDMIAYQANFHAETLDGLKSFESGVLEGSGSNSSR